MKVTIEHEGNSLVLSDEVNKPDKAGITTTSFANGSNAEGGLERLYLHAYDLITYFKLPQKCEFCGTGERECFFHGQEGWRGVFSCEECAEKFVCLQVK